MYPLGIYNLTDDSEVSAKQPLHLGRYDDAIII